ncbi:MAG TPA: class I SAM-dependent methyltransferase [Pyrinomonadaceae bacterium]|nr:class I SAM-dependent methyltransferase [Pyrinomonadaceae bacterium]
MSSRDIEKFKPTERFSDRVRNYKRFRPDYPRAVIELLRTETGLAPASQVADIGCGTGLLARLFLEEGCVVYGVEPNRAMREAGEEELARYSNFISVEGSAEATTLADESVDYVVAGQAFHWFDVPRARGELRRVLRTGGWAVLVWNNRRTETTPFLRAYEDFLRRFGTDYEQVSMKYAHEESLREFFEGDYRFARFDHRQLFDFEGLRGRSLSASYMPGEDAPQFAPMLERLREIFDEHQNNQQVSFDYDTLVYYGQIKS